MSESDGEAVKKGERSRRASGSADRSKWSGMSDSGVQHVLGSGDQLRRSLSSGQKTPNESMDTIANGALHTTTTAMDTSDDSGVMQKELTSFVREKLCRHFVIKMSDLKSMFNMHLAQLPPGHLLGQGVTEKLLEQSVYEAGGIKMINFIVKQEDTYFALSNVGDEYTVVREFLLDYLQKHPRVQMKTFRKQLQTHVESAATMEETLVKKLVKDYCEVKAGYYHLKGAGS